MTKTTRYWGRAAVALVWLYQGVCSKILADASAPQVFVVASVPYLASSAIWVLRAIGCMEVWLGIWVVSGSFARGCAAAQTLLLACMNVGGLVWAGAQIPDPAGMVLQNFAFLILAWLVAAGEVKR